jgi:hypothetical protein
MTKMSIFAVLAAVAVVFSPKANAMDHRSQYGVGGALGMNLVSPFGAKPFRDQVSSQFPAASVWGRYIPGTPEIGLELSYNYIALGTMNFSANTVILQFISRQNPWGNFHPFYGAGFGYARTSNKFATGDAGKFDDPITKLTAGIEFEMSDRLDLGLRIDHYSIFRDLNTQYTIHILAPMATVNYYFGTPALPPPPPKPEAAPVAAPSAPTITPTPAAPEVKETAPAVTHKATTPKKKTKKKKKKRAKGVPPAESENPQ